MLVDPGRRGGGDQCLPPERLPLVAETQAPVLDPRVVPPSFPHILDLEKVGEVAADLDPDPQVDWLDLRG